MSDQQISQDKEAEKNFKKKQSVESDTIYEGNPNTERGSSPLQNGRKRKQGSQKKEIAKQEETQDLVQTKQQSKSDSKTDSNQQVGIPKENDHPEQEIGSKQSLNQQVRENQKKEEVSDASRENKNQNEEQSQKEIQITKEDKDSAEAIQKLEAQVLEHSLKQEKNKSLLKQISDSLKVLKIKFNPEEGLEELSSRLKEFIGDGSIEVFVQKNLNKEESDFLNDESNIEDKIDRKDKEIKRMFEEEWRSAPKTKRDLRYLKLNVIKMDLFSFSNNKDRILEIYNLLNKIQEDLKRKTDENMKQPINALAMLLKYYESEIDGNFREEDNYSEKNVSNLIIKKQLEETNQNVQNLQNKISDLENIIAKKELDKEEIEGALKEALKKANTKDSELERLLNEATEFQQKIKKLEEDNKTLLQLIEQGNTLSNMNSLNSSVLQQLQNEKIQREGEISELKVKIKDLQNDQISQVNSQGELEYKISQKNGEINDLKSQLKILLGESKIKKLSLHEQQKKGKENYYINELKKMKEELEKQEERFKEKQSNWNEEVKTEMTKSHIKIQELNRTIKYHEEETQKLNAQCLMFATLIKNKSPDFFYLLKNSLIILGLFMLAVWIILIRR